MELTLRDRRNIAKFRLPASDWFTVLTQPATKETYDKLGIPSTMKEYEEYIKTHPVISIHIPTDGIDIY